MNLEGLSPEQLKLIYSLSKRIESLETKLVQVQGRVIRIDRILMDDLAKNMKHFNLN